MSILLETSGGDLVIDLLTEKAPLACKNILTLAKLGYFDGNLFFFVEKDYTVQTGDRSGTGFEGASIFGMEQGIIDQPYKDEIDQNEALCRHEYGAVSLAKGPDAAGNLSQFFIVMSKMHLEQLDKKHTVFGHVVEGFDVLDKINELPTDLDGRPLVDFVIKRAAVVFDAFPGSESLLKQIEFEGSKFAQRVPYEESLDALQLDASKKRPKAVFDTLQETADMARLKSKNTLFVGKLGNHVRRHDLKAIFSNFGDVRSVRLMDSQARADGRSDDGRPNLRALNFAFVEFKKEHDAQRAKVRMDGALIDDRVVAVDFAFLRQLSDDVEDASELARDYRAVEAEERESRFEMIFEE